MENSCWFSAERKPTLGGRKGPNQGLARSPAEFGGALEVAAGSRRSANLDCAAEIVEQLSQLRGGIDEWA